MSSKKKQKNKIRQTKSKQTESSTKLPIARYTNILMFTAFAVFIVLVTTYKIQGDDDIFWHLASGRYIVETKTVPSSDVFGFVTAGEKWIPFEWGWDVLTYSIYSFSGYTGLSVFRTIIFLLIFYLYYRILMKFNVSKSVFVLLGMVLVFGLMERFTPRPQIISYFFFVLVLYLIIEQRYFSRKNFRYLYFIPLIFLFWANMHMGMLSGIALFLIYLVSEALAYLYPKKYSDGKIPPLDRNHLIQLAGIFIVTLLTLLVNPHGFGTYAYTYSHLQMNVMKQTNEWLSPFNELFLGRFNNVIYILFLIWAAWILYYSYKKKDIFIALLAIVFAVYSTRSVRFSSDYMVIIFVFSALAFDYFINRMSSVKIKSFLLEKHHLRIILSSLLILFIITAANDKLYYTLRYIRATGFGIDNYFYPVKMFEFMKEHKVQDIGDKPFNSYENGGYFIWTFRGEKDFIDSRGLNDNIVDEYRSIEMKYPGFAQKLASYGIDYIPWSYPDIVMYPQYMKQAVVSYLIDKPDEWKLIYWDDNSFLFVKNEEKFKDLISKYGYKYVNPYNFAYRRNIIENAFRTNPAEVKEEINRKFNEDPTGTFIKAIYKTYYSNLTR